MASMVENKRRTVEMTSTSATAWRQGNSDAGGGKTSAENVFPPADVFISANLFLLDGILLLNPDINRTRDLLTPSSNIDKRVSHQEGCSGFNGTSEWLKSAVRIRRQGSSSYYWDHGESQRGGQDRSKRNHYHSLLILDIVMLWISQNDGTRTK
ncbi:hypothetical protein LXL04_002022 [Taraxacum kok-saghyz]